MDSPSLKRWCTDASMAAPAALEDDFGGIGGGAPPDDVGVVAAAAEVDI